jgi:hypothetical protein
VRLSPEERAQFVREFWPAIILMAVLFALLAVMFSVVPPTAVAS